MIGPGDVQYALLGRGKSRRLRPAGAGRHWLRVEVRDGKGSLQLTSSPLYINFPG